MNSRRAEPTPRQVDIVRSAVSRHDEAGRLSGEKTARIAEEVLFNLEGAIEAAAGAVRAGEMTIDTLRELRDIHALLRQRALGSSPQGRLV